MKIGVTELIIILVIVVVIFGPTQIPKLTKMFGKSVKNFRDGMSEESAEKKDDSDKKEESGKKDDSDKKEQNE